MGKKVLVLAGGPREKTGQTWILLRQLVKGVEGKGGRARVFNLNDPGFRGCQGCFHCRTHPDCAVKDILTPFYDEIADASGVVFASPIYFADITGQAKMGVDRMFPMLDGMSFSPRYPGKKAVTIFSQGDANAERFRPAIDRLEGLVQTLGWQIIRTLLSAGVGTPDHQTPESLMRDAMLAGEELAG